MKGDLATSWRFEAIGTTWVIDAETPLTHQTMRAVALRMDAFDRAWSRFRPGSVVDDLRTGPGRHRMPDDAGPLLATYETLFRLTDGAVSPCVGTSLERLGYDAAYSLRAGPPVASPSWADVRWEPPYLTTREPFVLDVGAAGKGYLADLVAETLRTHLGDAAFTVDASGDLVRRGPALRVALEHPLDPSVAVGVVELGGDGRGALCASAVNRRSWPGREGTTNHHVLDARTGRPTSGVLATWVLADDALTADAATTALFFVEPERLAAELDVACVVMGADRRLVASPDFPGELFT